MRDEKNLMRDKNHFSTEKTISREMKKISPEITRNLMRDEKNLSGEEKHLMRDENRLSPEKAISPAIKKISREIKKISLADFS